jgi:hypothetical protein
VIRLLWLLIVGSWRFPWEREKPSLPDVRCKEQRHGFEWSTADRFCNARAYGPCTSERCRAHCMNLCKCDERPIVECPREGGTYRSPPS